MIGDGLNDGALNKAMLVASVSDIKIIFSGLRRYWTRIHLSPKDFIKLSVSETIFQVLYFWFTI